MSKSTSKRRAAAPKPPKLPVEIVDCREPRPHKKAEQLTVLDLRKAAGFTDFFVHRHWRERAADPRDRRSG